MASGWITVEMLGFRDDEIKFTLDIDGMDGDVSFVLDRNGLTRFMNGGSKRTDKLETIKATGDFATKGGSNG